MDICDAIEEADHLDVAEPVQDDIEESGFTLAQDLKYPVDAHGRVMLINQIHPDLLPCLVYHLIRCGWRKQPSKALVKQRPVHGSMFADLVAYVPLSDPDEPIVAPPPEPAKLWSVTPRLNQIQEKRPQ